MRSPESGLLAIPLSEPGMPGAHNATSSECDDVSRTQVCLGGACSKTLTKRKSGATWQAES